MAAASDPSAVGMPGTKSGHASCTAEEPVLLGSIKEEIPEAFVPEDYSNVTVIEPQSSNSAEQNPFGVHRFDGPAMLEAQNSLYCQPPFPFPHLQHSRNWTNEVQPVFQAEQPGSASKRIFGYMYKQPQPEGFPPIRERHLINYVCNFCMHSFRSKNIFLNHMITHIFTCDFCSFSSLSRQALIAHVRSNHDKAISSFEEHIPLYLDQIKMVKRISINGVLEKAIVPLEEMWEGEYEREAPCNTMVNSIPDNINSAPISFPISSASTVVHLPAPDQEAHDTSGVTQSGVTAKNQEDPENIPIRFNLGLPEVELTLSVIRLNENLYKCDKCQFMSPNHFVMISHLDAHRHQILRCGYCCFSTNVRCDITTHHYAFHADKTMSVSDTQLPNIIDLITDQRKFVLYSCVDCCFAKRSRHEVIQHISKMHPHSFRIMYKIHKMPEDLATFLVANHNQLGNGLMDDPKSGLPDPKINSICKSPPAKRRCVSEHDSSREQRETASYKDGVKELEPVESNGPQAVINLSEKLRKLLTDRSPPKPEQESSQNKHPAPPSSSPETYQKVELNDQLSKKVVFGRYGKLDVLVCFLKELPSDLQIDLSQYVETRVDEQSGVISITCRLCGQENHSQFAASRMREHCMRHAEVRSWECMYCSHKCNRPSGIITHTRSQHPNRRLVIVRRKPFSPSIFTQKSRTGGGSTYLVMYDTVNPDRVIRNTWQAYTWLCPFCGRRDIRQKMMMIHVRMCHPQHKFALKDMVKVPRQSPAYQILCTEARQRIRSAQVTLVHMKDMRKYEKLQKILDNQGSDSEMEGCENCDQFEMDSAHDMEAWNKQVNLTKYDAVKRQKQKRRRRHLNSIAKRWSRYIPQARINGSLTRGSFQCIHCKLRFKHIMWVKQHIAARHKDMELTTYFCGGSKKKYYFMCPYPTCYYASSIQSGMSTHREKHPKHFLEIPKPDKPEKNDVGSEDGGPDNPESVEITGEELEEPGNKDEETDSADEETVNKPVEAPAQRKKNHNPRPLDTLDCHYPVFGGTVPVKMKTRFLHVPVMSANVTDVLLRCYRCEYDTRNTSNMKVHLLTDHSEVQPVAVDVHRRAQRRAARVHFCPLPNCSFNSYYAQVMAVHVPSVHPEFKPTYNLSDPNTKLNLSQNEPKLWHSPQSYFPRNARALVFPEYRCAFCPTFKGRHPGQVRTHQLNCHFERPITVIDLKAKINKQRARIFYCENPNCDFHTRIPSELNRHECVAVAPEVQPVAYTLDSTTDMEGADTSEFPTGTVDGPDQDESREITGERSSSVPSTDIARTYQCSFCNWITGSLTSIQLHCQIEHNSAQDAYTEIATRLGLDGEVVMRINPNTDLEHDPPAFESSGYPSSGLEQYGPCDSVSEACPPEMAYSRDVLHSHTTEQELSSTGLEGRENSTDSRTSDQTASYHSEHESLSQQSELL